MNRDKVQVGDSIVPAAAGVIVVAPQDGMDDKRLAAGELPVFNCAGGRDALPAESRETSPRHEPSPAGAPPTLHRTTSFSVLDILDPNKFTSKKQTPNRTGCDFTFGAENRSDDSNHTIEHKSYQEDYDCKKTSGILSKLPLFFPCHCVHVQNDGLHISAKVHTNNIYKHFLFNINIVAYTLKLYN